MFRGLMRMAAIAGAGYVWRKFRSRNSNQHKFARSSFDSPTTGRSASFSGSERRFGARDRRLGSTAYSTAGSADSY